MAKITNDLKRMQRISLVISRALERCFSSAKVSCLSCKFEYDKFAFEISSTIVDYSRIDIDVSDKSVEKCMSISIKKLLEQVDNIIKDLNARETNIRQDIKEYGEAFGESPAVNISSAQMFKQIIENIKI